MTGAQAIERIHSIYPNRKKNGLSNMKTLLAKLGDPQARIRTVHVAGTNGKGSCCAMIERMLREAGYRTGLYTSPYVEVYNERIRLCGAPVTDEKLAALVEGVWPAVEACAREGVFVTEFELGTALAFVCFAQEKVDAAVIEVGLGGRIDPTNVITPLVSVITEVGMDHMDYLGATVGEIALEKAGIMKRGVPVSLGAQEKEAYGVLMAAARGKGCPVIDPDAENVRETADDITFDVRLAGERVKGLTVALRGRHQAENACAALGAIEALRRQGFDIPLSAVRAGMASVRWPGRLERFGRVMLDGAHNDPGVRALCAYADAWLPRERTVLLTGMLADKETDKMVARLAPRARRVVCAAPNVPRALDAQRLSEAFARAGKRAEVARDAAHALARARELAGPEGTVLAAGSLYLIGELRALLRREEDLTDDI